VKNANLKEQQPLIFGAPRHYRITLNSTSVAFELAPQRGIGENRLTLQICNADPAFGGLWVKFGENTADARGVFLAYGQSQIWVWPNVPQQSIYGVAEKTTCIAGVVETLD
jgi:hypothetical protein